jgi:hypothetical protein
MLALFRRLFGGLKDDGVRATEGMDRRGFFGLVLAGISGWYVLPELCVLPDRFLTADELIDRMIERGELRPFPVPSTFRGEIDAEFLDDRSANAVNQQIVTDLRRERRYKGLYGTVALLFLLSILPAYSQVTKTQNQPDCSTSFTLTAAAQDSPIINNLNLVGPCVAWTMSYSSTGFSALSLVIQDAPDAAGAPGTFVTFAGAVNTGINPNTAITSATTELTGYYPWMKVHLTSVTGSGKITGTLYGWKNSASGSGGGGGGTTGDVNLIEIDGVATVTGGIAGSLGVGGNAANGAAISGSPVLTGGSDGANRRTLLTDTSGRSIVLAGSLDGSGAFLALQNCTKHAIISAASSGNNQIIALSGSTTIRVCHWDVTPASALDIKLTTGTGTACATGVADLTGLSQQVVAIVQDYGADAALLTPAGNAVCINLSGAVSTTGTITYAQY